MASEDISGYSLRRGLGSGSAGTVWLLRDLATGRHAVLKRIPKSAVVAKNEFLGDLELARTIDHPHVARLLEVRESDREWLLFSQYVAAGTLTSLLERRGALSPGELVTLISPLAQGLSALHRSGLTHGHLDIDDIMFDADGRPVITDAGLRTLAPPTTPEADLTALGTIAHQAGGTPKTFPPSLFTTTPELLAQQALHRATPLPISLNFTNDPHPTPTPTTTPRTPPTTTPRTPPTTNSTTRPDTPSTARPATSPPPATPFTNPTDPTSPTTPLTDRTGPPSLTTPFTDPNGAPSPMTPFTDPTGPTWPTPPLTDRTGPPSPTTPFTDPTDPPSLMAPLTDPTGPTSLMAPLTDPTGPASPTAPLTDPTGPAPPTTPVVAATTPQSPSLTTAYSAPGTAPASSAATGGAVSLRRAQPPTRGRGSLPRSAHRGSASRQANRRPARRSALQFLRTKRAAYGVLAACGAGAVTTLILGLIAVGVLGHPATSSTAAADQPPQPSTSHQPATPPTSSASHPTPPGSPQTPTGPHRTPTTSRSTPTASRSTPTTSRSTATTSRSTPATPQRTPAGSRPPRAPAAQSTRAAASRKWLQTLQALDVRRSHAFATLDPTELNAVYLPGSTPWSADRDLLASYRKQQLHIEGLRLQIHSVTVESTDTTTVVLRIVDRLIAGTAVTPSGQRTTFPPGKPTTRRVTLTTTTSANTWRISEIAKA